MAKKQSNKRGYGLHNVERRRVTKRDVKKLLDKPWDSVSSLELNQLVQFGKSTEELQSHYKVTVVRFLNRLRYL